MLRRNMGLRLAVGRVRAAGSADGVARGSATGYGYTFGREEAASGHPGLKILQTKF